MINIANDWQPHIVEFGCATGLLLSQVNKLGYTNITGVDPSPACAATAKKYYGINVLANTFSDASFKKGSIDVLILVGVLEHVRDLDTTLKKLWELLSPKGKIFIAVPDGSQYFNGQDAPFQEFSVEHINYFGPGSLTNLMSRYGFAKVDISQVMIEVNYKVITPVIMSVYEKSTAESGKIEFDAESKANLTTYIENCNKKEGEVKAIINKIVDKGDPIVIWGTGAQTLRLLANSRLCDAKIAAFVDSNPKYQDKMMNGVPVISPNSLIGRKESILISTRAYQNEIEMQIRNVLKLENEIIKLY